MPEKEGALDPARHFLIFPWAPKMKRKALENAPALNSVLHDKALNRGGVCAKTTEGRGSESMSPAIINLD